MTAKEIVQSLKEKYPSPVKKSSAVKFDDKDRYCVGGAFYKEFDKNNVLSFPPVDILSNMLRKVNSNLDRDLAFVYSMQIVKANDSECFETAWYCLEKALDYGKENNNV